MAWIAIISGKYSVSPFPIPYFWITGQRLTAACCALGVGLPSSSVRLQARCSVAAGKAKSMASQRATSSGDLRSEGRGTAPASVLPLAGAAPFGSLESVGGTETGPSVAVPAFCEAFGTGAWGWVGGALGVDGAPCWP